MLFEGRYKHWLVVLGFNATLTAKVISWRSVTHMCFLAFSHTSTNTTFLSKSHRLLFSNASAELRGENTPERKFASTGDRTHNHQVMSPTRSPLSHPDGYDTNTKLFSIFFIYFLFHHLSFRKTEGGLFLLNLK